MSPLSSFVSSPKHALPTSPRRLVKPLRRAHDLDFERARRAAQRRGRKRRQQVQKLVLTLGMPLGALSLWMGARAMASYRSVWLGGPSIQAGISCQNSPVAVASSWFFASEEGSVWRADTKTTAPQKVWRGTFPSSPQVVGVSGGVIIAGGDGTLASLDTQGRMRWSVKHSGSLFPRPALLQNGASALIVGGDDAGRVWARDARDGKTLWSQDAGVPIGEGVTATPWGVVVPLLGHTTSRGGLRCFAGEGGQVKWSFPANPRDRAAGTAIPRFDAATNRVFWCNDLGAVFALDARTGSKIWKSFVAPRAGARNAVVLRASPVLVNGVLVVGGNDGGLRAFDARDGHALWTRWLGQSLSEPLGKARLGNRIVVVAGAKPVVLVDAQSGQLVRQLGAGVVGWNGREFAASDEVGTWHFWAS
ncbi:outer membrane protein assembly factor BamB [Abditibacteriota bacterium]|nr:outer membrane protein assembly factor BamB [Abditibacteriota bacterium]